MNRNRTAQPTATTNTKRRVHLAILALGVLAVAMCGLYLASSYGLMKSGMEKVGEKCNVPATSDAITMNVAGPNSTKTVLDLTCVMAETGAPSSLLAQMTSTRTLDGMQTVTWDGHSARWNYHPNTGLNVFFLED